MIPRACPPSMCRQLLSTMLRATTVFLLSSPLTTTPLAVRDHFQHPEQQASGPAELNDPAVTGRLPLEPLPESAPFAMNVASRLKGGLLPYVVPRNDSILNASGAILVVPAWRQWRSVTNRIRCERSDWTVFVAERLVKCSQKLPGRRLRRMAMIASDSFATSIGTSSLLLVASTAGPQFLVTMLLR